MLQELTFLLSIRKNRYHNSPIFSASHLAHEYVTINNNVLDVKRNDQWHTTGAIFLNTQALYVWNENEGHTLKSRTRR